MEYESPDESLRMRGMNLNILRLFEGTFSLRAPQIVYDRIKLCKKLPTGIYTYRLRGTWNKRDISVVRILAVCQYCVNLRLDLISRYAV